MDLRRQVGNAGEERAAKFLKKLGYRILARNLRMAGGELDLIARDGNELVFVEVRTLGSATARFPEQSIGPKKQHQLARLATTYVQQNKFDGDWRIDVVAIDADGLRHIKNAIGLW
jgi:putative endonuclease